MTNAAIRSSVGLAIVLAGWLCSSTMATAAPRPTCAAGLAALRAGHLRTAEAVYSAVVPSASPCAQQGSASAAALLQARQLAALGLTSAADTEIERALQAEPALSIPRDVLPETTGRKGGLLAERLEREGFHKQAVQVLLRVIESDPAIRLNHGDQEILGQAGHPWYWELWHFVTRPLALTAELILVVLALGIYPRFRRRLHLQEFSSGDGAAAGLASAALLRALIRDELRRLSEESARRPDGRPLRLDHAGPYEGQFELGAVADSLPMGWKLLSLVTGLLIDRLGSRCRLVTGRVLAADTVVLGIETVHGRVQQTNVIRYDQLGFPDPGPDALAQLALPAAAWIVLAHCPDATLGGTRQWTSFIDFAAGCAWQARGDLNRAMDFYRRACEDPANRAAAVNLAALEQLQERSAPQVPPAGRASYRRLTRLIEDRESDDLQWYRARYLLSVGLRDVVDSKLAAADDRYYAAGGPAPLGMSASAASSPARLNGTTRSAGRSAPAPQVIKGIQELLVTARHYAVELAIRLEDRRVSGTGSIPGDFFARGRAAALTLLARQVFIRAENLQESSVPASEGGTFAYGLTEESIRYELWDLSEKPPRRGASERLVDFVGQHLELDDQAHYNLFRYHRTRADIYAENVRLWQQRLDAAEPVSDVYPPDQVAAWRSQVLLWQDLMEAQHQDELGRLERYRAEILRAGDPVLVDEVRAVGLDETRPSRHHPLYGTAEQPPLPKDAPPEWPWVPETEPSVLGGSGDLP